MKKSIALILILALMVAMSTTVFATEPTENVSGNSQEVLASYEEGTQDKTIISVDISWEQMSFTYKGESVPTWNAEEHRYEGEATEAGWASGEGIITIRNNSNAVLKAQIKYTAESAYSEVGMSFTENAPYIGSAYTDDNVDAEGEVCGTPCQVTVKAIPTGALPKETVDNTRIGAITISLSPEEVDVYGMLDALFSKIDACNIDDPSTLTRGTPYLTEDAEALQELVTTALITYAEEETHITEKNVAINAALTSVYGALNIAQ